VKKVLAFTASLLAATPAMGRTGHIIQVHWGTDCVEFVLLEDAFPACGSNLYLPSGAVNDACLSTVPWYGVPTGQGSGQAPPPVPVFVASTSAIAAAYRAYIGQLQLEYVQEAITGVVVSNIEAALLDTSSIVGFDLTNVTLLCKNLGASSGKHATNGIGAINTPPDPNQ
jgi:hypothetical protein